MVPKIFEIRIIFLVCLFVAAIIVEVISRPSPERIAKQTDAWLETQIAIIVADRCAESKEKETCIEDLTKSLEIPEETKKFVAAREKS
ncbi:MAG: hypothetical protein K0U39_03745 [Alphaproteobacteria bacterium]|nr:hypothetical protein [Alphaproteobacteria bacterium]